MSQEIENYLIDKFRNGLKDPKVCCKREFQELEPLILNCLQLESLQSSSTETSVNEQLHPDPQATSSAPSKKCLREILYSLNNVFTECQSLSSKHPLVSPDKIYSLYKIRQKIKQIKVHLDEKNKTPPGSVNGSMQNNVQLSSSVAGDDTKKLSQDDRFEVYGFQDEIVALEKMLVRTNKYDFKAVGVVGMGGTGKTTLCKELLKNSKELRKNFVPRILVSMSEKPNQGEDPKEAIVKRMLRSLGVDEEVVDSIAKDHKLHGLLCALHVQLMGKKYLIVLDDVRGVDEWFERLYTSFPGNEWEKKLAYGLPKGYGGTVVVTSRNEEVIKKMVGEENMHKLQTLSNPDSCWAIFESEAKKDGVQINPSEELKKQILHKCAGLPSAVKMMGQIMNEQIKEGHMSGESDSVQAEQPTENVTASL